MLYGVIDLKCFVERSSKQLFYFLILIEYPTCVSTLLLACINTIRNNYYEKLFNNYNCQHLLKIMLVFTYICITVFTCMHSINQFYLNKVLALVVRNRQIAD